MWTTERLENEHFDLTRMILSARESQLAYDHLKYRYSEITEELNRRRNG